MMIVEKYLPAKDYLLTINIPSLAKEIFKFISFLDKNGGLELLNFNNLIVILFNCRYISGNNDKIAIKQLKKAWEWLIMEGYILPEPNSLLSNSYIISEKGERFTNKYSKELDIVKQKIYRKHGEIIKANT